MSDDDFGCIHPDLLSVEISSHASESTEFCLSERFDLSNKDIVSDNSKKRLSNQTEMNAVGLSNDGGVRQATIQDSSRPLERLQTSSFGETINNTAEKNFPQPSDYLNDVNHVNETAPKSSAELADYQSIEQNNSIPHSTDSQVQPCHNDSPFAGFMEDHASSISSTSSDDVYSRSDVDTQQADVKDSNSSPSVELMDRRSSSAPPVEDISSSLHDSVQSVNHSLAKLSQVLKNKHTQPEAIPHLECDYPSEGCTETKPIPSLPPRMTELGGERFLFDDEAFSIPLTSNNFVNEVMSAIGDKRLFSLSKACDDKTSEPKKNESEDVYTNVVEWGRAVRSVPEQQASKKLCKIGVTKRRDLHRHVSLQEKGSRNVDVPLAARATLARRYSDGCRRESNQLSVRYSTIDGPCTELDGAEIHPESKPFGEFDDACAFGKVIQPSAFHVYEHPCSEVGVPYNRELQSTAHLSLPDDFRKRRYSITSADLEDIFSDFADRSCRNSYEEQDAQVSNGQSSSSTQSDHQLLKACGSVKPENNTHEDGTCPAIMVSRSCQTEVCKNKIKTSSKPFKPQLEIEPHVKHAISPPVVNEFLERTGNWTELLQDGNSVIPAESSRMTNKNTLAVPVDIRTRSTPNIHLDYALKPSSSSVSISKRPTRPIQPASHLQALKTTYCAPAAPCQSPPLCGRDSDEGTAGTFHLTPSKLSFQNKLSMFQSRADSAANQRPSCPSASEKHKPLSCHELAYTTVPFEDCDVTAPTINKTSLEESELADSLSLARLGNPPNCQSTAVEPNPVGVSSLERDPKPPQIEENPPCDGLVNSKKDPSRVTRTHSYIAATKSKKVVQLKSSRSFSMDSLPNRKKQAVDDDRSLTDDLAKIALSAVSSSPTTNSTALGSNVDLQEESELAPLEHSGLDPSLNVEPCGEECDTSQWFESEDSIVKSQCADTSPCTSPTIIP